MIRIQFIWSLLISVLLLACSESNEPIQKENNMVEIDQTSNLLNGLQEGNVDSLKWFNPPQKWELTNGTLQVIAKKGTDFFNNPEDNSIVGSAPLLYQDVEGDFIAKALVQPDFNSQWNACALMVYQDSTHWIKFAFEDSDATGKSIVSVVTKNVSDDANGVILNDHDQVWLKIVRKNDLYSMHWSSDGLNYKMARLTTLPHAQSVKIGLEAQSPVGDAATHSFLYFSIESQTVEDIRKGE